MAFLCPVRLKKDKKKRDQAKASLPVGRITGSASLDTLAQVQTAKQSGSKVHMVIVQDFEPCVNDEIRVRRGEYVKVLYQENDWLYILTLDGREGFVPYDYCLPLERSVDDFVKLEDQEERQLKHTGPSIDPKRCTSEKEQRSHARSVPDIAWNCESATRGSRLQSNRLTRSTRSDSGSRVVQTRNASSRQGTSQSFSVGHQDNEFGVNSRGFDRTNYASSTSRHSTKSSSLKPHAAVPTDFVSKGQVNNSFSAATGNPDKHIYVNDDIVRDSWISQRTSSTKPDILPASAESTISSENRKMSHSGSEWRNLSTRSAPATWSASSNRQTASRRLEHRASHARTRRHSQEIGYTTAQVTCDLFRSSSQASISVFAKSNKGTYVMLYDYEKQDEGDLNVRKGEFVTVLNTDDPDWFWVINSWDEEGFVPASYLCLAKEPSSSYSGPHNHQTYTPTINHSRSVSLPVTSQDRGHKDLGHLDLSQSIKLVCLYSYVAETKQHLSISRGDWLYADYDSQPNEDWLWVYSPQKQKSGYVPRSYVKAPNFGFQARSSGYDGDVNNVRATRHMESRQYRDPFTSP